MTSQQILQSDLLEILFEKRNKQYGAYQLRKTYPRELAKAVAITISAVFLLLFFIRPVTANQRMADTKPQVVVVDQFVIPEEKKPEPLKEVESRKAEPVKHQTFTDQLTIVNKEIVDPLPHQDLLERVAISNVTTDGKDVTTLQPPVNTPAETKGESNVPAKKEAPEEVVPDKQPQYPGGMQAWIRFLQMNLQAPQDLEPGEKRVVQVRFHVAEDGSITNFQVLKSAGTAFDNEVIRVLKKMPKWTPAVKAGFPVSVSFTQPVTFVGQEK